MNIPYGRQSISTDDIKSVVDILKSDWLTQGPAVEIFEKAVAHHCGSQYAVAVNSATSALHIACLAAGLGPGDTLWTSPNTFVASANCALYCGACVDFVDINPATFNMSCTSLEKRLLQAKKDNKLPKIVIPVHFAGQSCEMTEIKRLSEAYGFTIIEDASHAIGGSYKNIPVGSCTYSDMTIFSFHPVKIITTGEGGMVLTNNKKLHDQLIRLRSHGIIRDPMLMQGSSDGPWYYQQIELGFNYRITDIQAALGTSQLQRLNEFVSRRHELVKIYNAAFEQLPLITPWQHPDTYSAFHLYVIRLQTEKIRQTHRQVFEQLRASGILVNLHYIPVHLQPYYQNLGFKAGDFPESEKYYREAISLPLYYSLSNEDQCRVISAVREAVAA